MSVNFENLKLLKLEQLRELAVKQGVTFHHNAKEDLLIRLILEAANAQPDALKHPAANAPKEEMRLNTEEEIREACKRYFEKPGFEAMFRDDDTWHFRYKGAEDSGHMSVKLRVIRMKAETVAGGARKMVTVKNALGQDVMLA